MTSDEVGYGKPPRRHRFPPGRSGNPGGRPKKRASLLDDLGEALDAQEGGVTRQKAIVARLVKEAASGDLKAAQLVISLARSIGHDDHVADEADEEALARFVRAEIEAERRKE